MKKTLPFLLLPFSILLIFCSCNPKVKIVERQKAIKNEFAVIDAKAFHFSEQKKKLDDDELSARLDLKNSHDTSIVMKIRRNVYSIADSSGKYQEIKTRLLSEYDSLEMELKKY